MEQSLFSEVELQKALAARVKLQAMPRVPETVAALDAAYLEQTTFAAASLFLYGALQEVETQVTALDNPAPYIPGFFSLREAPAVLQALKLLSRTPDVILIDGHGIAHPRRCGLASHIGVLAGIPTVGCAKEPLCGSYSEPGREKGSRSLLLDGGEVVGAVVRTRSGVKPVFVSVGNLVTLDEAVEVVLHCCSDYRIPEPLRAADSACRAAKREAEETRSGGGSAT